MPTQFSFDASYITTATPIERGDFTTGSYGSLLKTPSTWYSAVAPSQSIATSGGVDVFSMTMMEGQRYAFNLGSATTSLEFNVIDQSGKLIATSQDYNDAYPDLSLIAPKTGTYYIAVHHTTNDYIEGSFGFERPPTPTGSYQFSVATPSIPTVVRLSDSSNSYGDTAGSHTVKAFGGNDVVSLYDGNDIGLGGSGNDQIYGGSGNDELSGGSGFDRLDGGTGNDVLNGGNEFDWLTGGDDRDALNGGAGNDTLEGGNGNDTLWGEAHNDSLYGGSGNDMLRGGSGVDRLYGGTGADTFHFLPTEANFDSSGFNEDRIMDFESSDRIDLSDVFTGNLYWLGNRSFDSRAGSFEVRVADFRGSIGYQEVQVNLDSDSTPELSFLVKTVGTLTLQEGHFLL